MNEQQRKDSLDISRILNEMADESPAIAELFASMTPDKLRFENLKWRYYNSGKHKNFRQQYFCWSITRNKNDKYLSWIYDWKWDPSRKTSVGHYVSVVEHSLKKSAKARAYKLYQQRMAQINSSKDSQSHE